MRLWLYGLVLLLCCLSVEANITSILVHCSAGIDDPYEEPQAAECVLEAYDASGKQRKPEDLAQELLDYLTNKGLLKGPK